METQFFVELVFLKLAKTLLKTILRAACWQEGNHVAIELQGSCATTKSVVMSHWKGHKL